MINKLKSFVDIDPALSGAPTEGSNGLKFVTALKSDVSSKVGGSIDKFASKTQLSIGDTAGNFVGGAIGGVSNFTKDVLSGVDTGILGNAASKVYDVAGNVVSKVDSVTGGVIGKTTDIAGNILNKAENITGGVTSKVGMVSNTITEKTDGLVNVSDYSPYNFDANNLKDKSIDRFTGKATDKVTSVIGSTPLDVVGKVESKSIIVNEKVGGVINTVLDSSVGEKVGGYVGSKVGESVGSKLGTAIGGYLPTNKIANTIGSNLGSVGSSVGKYVGKTTGIETQSKLRQTIGKRVKVVKIPKLPDPASINNKINNTIGNI